ncbi:MAG: CoA ester lyase [Myxococcota bacterium]
MNRLRRSVLFMPGDSHKKITKASTLDVDCIVMDLEDGVASTQKQRAREVTLSCCHTLSFGRREKCVRINALDTALYRNDVHATITGQPDAYVVPKCADAAALKQLCAELSQLEAAHGIEAFSIRLFALIESALGVLNVKEVATSTPRIEALLFGAEDLAGDIGAQRTSEEWEVFYARSAVVTTAAAYGLDAIDAIYPAFNDVAGLGQASRAAKQYGYSGKMAIHPNQLDVIHRVFSPSAEELHQAHALLTAYQYHTSQGLGAFSLDGKMVDMPMIRHAQTVLEKARKAGLLDGTANEVKQGEG